MNKKYPTFFLTWFNKFLRVPYPGHYVYNTSERLKSDRHQEEDLPDAEALWSPIQHGKARSLTKGL